MESWLVGGRGGEGGNDGQEFEKGSGPAVSYRRRGGCQQLVEVALGQL